MANYVVSEENLTSIANAIRTKGETSASLEFPDDFVSAIENIGGGGGGITPVTGTITPSAQGQQTISFGKTINSYFVLIELTDESKASLISEGINANRAYAFWSIYPKPSIHSQAPSNSVVTYARFNASTDEASIANASATMSTTDIQINAYPVTASSAATLIVGYTYNWTVIPI